MDFDVIGDVHGYADELEALLGELGYVHRAGAFRHPDPGRMALFLGDLVDRGPKQLESIDIPRRMRDAGTALVLMGNHEHNAIGWFMPDPARDGHFLRLRGSKNRSQHRVFLEQAGEDGPLHEELVEWMTTLPMFIETEGFRAAHACWHSQSLDLLAGHVEQDGALSRDSLLASFDKASPLRNAAEIVLKGLEIDLPDGVFFYDKDGIRREKSRLRWWDETARTYASAAVAEEGLELPDVALPPEAIVEDGSGKPVFFGHYWLQGTPRILNPKRTCLDFSIAKDGVLCAYSWRGEDELDPANLTWVGSPAPAAGATFLR